MGNGSKYKQGMVFSDKLPFEVCVIYMSYLLFFSCSFCGHEYCHTRLHLGFSAELRIRQLPACEMEPQSGLIFRP